MLVCIVSPRCTALQSAFELIRIIVLDTGLFQAALSLALVLYKGLALTQALEAALAAMATACVQKQLEAAQDHAPSADAHLVFGQAPDLQGKCVMSLLECLPCCLEDMECKP